MDRDQSGRARPLLRGPRFEELVAITLGIVPELLVANGVLSADDASEVPVKVLAERREIARLVA